MKKLLKTAILAALFALFLSQGVLGADSAWLDDWSYTPPILLTTP